MLPRRWNREQSMSRYRDITAAEMNPAQKRVHDLIIAGRRGRFGGPFQLLIRAPEICEHASQLGEHLRWGTSLPDRLSELAIITTARFWRAQYEWYPHPPLAQKARGSAAPLEMPRAGGPPAFTAQAGALLSRACTESSRPRRLPAASFGGGVKAPGETGLVEVTAIIEYSPRTGTPPNVSKAGRPGGKPPPFPE